MRQSRAHEVRFVELAQTVNSEMPRHVIERVGTILNDQGKAMRDARILGIGVAYKGGTEDTRHSPAVTVLERIASRGAKVSYHDPLVPETIIGERNMHSVKLDRRRLHETDLVLILAKQTGVDWDLIAEHANHVIDTCNALGRPTGGNITRL